MKPRSLFGSTLVCCLALVATQCATRPGSTEIPHLQKRGAAIQLIVDGKPFLALAGELNNDSATNIGYVNRLWPRLVHAKINTVLTGVSWNQIERQEGKFDFSVLDGVILTFSPNTPGPPLAGLATVEEGSFVKGRWVPGRLMAGDSTEEGESIRLLWAPGSWVPVYRQRAMRTLSSA